MVYIVKTIVYDYRINMVVRKCHELVFYFLVSYKCISICGTNNVFISSTEYIMTINKNKCKYMQLP